MKARRLTTTLLTLSGAFAAMLASCGGSDDAAFSSSIPDGQERGACRMDGSCDVGLECRSQLCVMPGSSSGGSNGSTGGSASMSDAGESSSTAGKSMTTGGSNPTAGSGMTDGGASLGGGGDPGSAGAGGGGGPVECNGSHPLLNGKTRYCAEDACYCNDPFDTCFPSETAAACCENTPRCGAQPGDRGVNCTGSHPIIEPVRTCAPGNCFCSDGDIGDWDVCLPEDVADSCCPPGVSLTCVE